MFENFVQKSTESTGAMFETFNKCAAELEQMRADGSLMYVKTPEGELSVQSENGLIASKYNDDVFLYELFQTPTFKEFIGKEKNFATLPDTGEPRLVYHATPVDIDTNEGLKPSIRSGRPLPVIGRKVSVTDRIRRKLDLYPKINHGLYFATIAETTKIKAQSADSKVYNEHMVYPCFIRINRPDVYDLADPDSKQDSTPNNQPDGEIRILSKEQDNIDFAVKSQTQVMHVPFNPLGVYKR